MMCALSVEHTTSAMEFGAPTDTHEKRGGIRMWTHSGILLEVREDGRKFVFASDTEEFKMFTSEYGELHEEWTEDLEQLNEPGMYQIIIGYGGFWEGTNPHRNKKVYAAYKLTGKLDWMPHSEGELLGGSRYECLGCQSMFITKDGINHLCPQCRKDDNK
jgi:hypothetical protein